MREAAIPLASRTHPDPNADFPQKRTIKLPVRTGTESRSVASPCEGKRARRATFKSVISRAWRTAAPLPDPCRGVPADRGQDAGAQCREERDPVRCERVVPRYDDGGQWRAADAGALAEKEVIEAIVAEGVAACNHNFREPHHGGHGEHGPPRDRIEAKTSGEHGAADDTQHQAGHDGLPAVSECGIFRIIGAHGGLAKGRNGVSGERSYRRWHMDTMRMAWLTSRAPRRAGARPDWPRVYRDPGCGQPFMATTAKPAHG